MRALRPWILSLSLTLVPLAAGCRAIAAIDAPLGLTDDTAYAQVELGQTLFHDPRLSREGDVSCASCHDAALGGADGRATSIGTGGQVGRRNAPSVLSAALKTRFFWDGRAETLEEQATGPLLAANEMGATPESIAALLSSRPGYVALFARAFPADPSPNLDNAARAIAAYERRLPTPGRVDAFLRGDASALSDEEQRGYALFDGECAFCHDGPGVGGQRFERLGVERPWPAERSADLGRYEVTGSDGDRLVFFVPSLRHVARTAPYFHDGSVATLEEAIALMGEHQVGRTLTDDEIRALAAFLRALDAQPPAELTTAPPLP